MAQSPLTNIARCAIDTGAQKYVLIRTKRSQGDEALFVRGNRDAPYHKDVARPFLNFAEDEGIHATVLGGGKIELDDQSKHVNIYGSSQGYPWAGKPMHNVAAQLLRQHLGGDYTVNAEGEDESA